MWVGLRGLSLSYRCARASQRGLRVSPGDLIASKRALKAS